jgi:hypothetical protein
MFERKGLSIEKTNLTVKKLVQSTRASKDRIILRDLQLLVNKKAA